MTNTYSSQWFDLFLRRIPAGQTKCEVDFLRRLLPNPPYVTVLDLCCGEGRHALPLARSGYHVTGIDVDEAAIITARRDAGDLANVSFMNRDMRALDGLPGPCDAVICLWQSFGYHDEGSNARILSDISRLLRPGGKLILDLYHPRYFERNQGSRAVGRAGINITETRRMNGDRLVVRLDYESGAHDEFAWQLFTPEQLHSLAAPIGLELRLVCTGFDEARPVSCNSPRVQLVFQRM